MPVLRAELATDKASRYLVQFCRHAAAMGSRGPGVSNHLHGATGPGLDVTAEWSATEGTVLFGPSGRCTLTADGNTLMVEIAAADESELSRIREIVTRDFAHFTHRAPVPVNWARPDSPSDVEAVGGEQFAPKRRHLRRIPIRTALLVLAVLAVVGLHLGLAGTLASRLPWTGMAIDLLLALVVLKVAVIGFARLAFSRRRSGRTDPSR